MTAYIPSVSGTACAPPACGDGRSAVLGAGDISGKHLAAYVEYMQAKGLSASTIKTDLSGIRFFHSKISSAKYKLPSNDELSVELERRRFGGVDRTWSQREFGLFLCTCWEAGCESYCPHTGIDGQKNQS